MSDNPNDGNQQKITEIFRKAKSAKVVHAQPQPQQPQLQWHLPPPLPPPPPIIYSSPQAQNTQNTRSAKSRKSSRLSSSIPTGQPQIPFPRLPRLQTANQQVTDMVKPMLLSGLSDPDNRQITVRHEIHGVQPQHAQGQPQIQPQLEIAEENVEIEVNDQGQENGENVVLNQTFNIQIARLGRF